MNVPLEFSECLMLRPGLWERGETGPLERALAAAQGGWVQLTTSLANPGPDYFRRLSSSPIPLGVFADVEWGLGRWIPEATLMPSQMALGAAGSEQLAYRWGHAVGMECRWHGVDWVGSPVVDVNFEPCNPVINTRSFGDRAADVLRLALALTRGLIDAGVLPTLKHFPGHGRSREDSHVALPRIDASADELEQGDLLPFRGVAAGVSPVSVMTGHLLVPALDESQIPIRSSRIVSTWLRPILPESAIVVTDSLGMGALGDCDRAELAVRALGAGHDVVITNPGDAGHGTYPAVRDAVGSGRMCADPVQQSIERSRGVKTWIASRTRVEPDYAAHRALALEIARAAVFRRGPRFPATGDGRRRILAFLDSDTPLTPAGEIDDGAPPAVPVLAAALRGGGLVQGSTPWPAHEHQAPAAARRGDKLPPRSQSVIAAIFQFVGAYRGRSPFLETTVRDALARLHAEDRLEGVLLFGSPYAVRDVPHDVPVLIGFDRSPATVRAVAEAALGAFVPAGRLPVTIPPADGAG